MISLSYRRADIIMDAASSPTGTPRWIFIVNIVMSSFFRRTLSLEATMVLTTSNPPSCWWRHLPPGSLLVNFQLLALASVVPTLTAGSWWQVTSNNYWYQTFVSGGYDNVWLDDILEFSPSSGEWSLQDNMMKTRNAHALSVISVKDVEQFCNWNP